MAGRRYADDGNQVVDHDGICRLSSQMMATFSPHLSSFDGDAAALLLMCNFSR